MLPQLPLHVPVTFGLVVLATLWLLYRAFAAARLNATLLIGALVGWLALQAILTALGLYVGLSTPPRLVVLGILPAMLVILYVMLSPAGKRFTDRLPLQTLTYLSAVRVPVEVVLWWLYGAGAVPELMTFEGRNFDILAGLTAPLVAYVGFRNGTPRRGLLLGWNLLSLGLLLNIVANGLLSSPTPFQQFAFEQPNIALAYFPFSWLPTFVVPVVLWTHLVAIRRVYRRGAVELLTEPVERRG